jgi:hypothetical protein
MRKMLLIGCVLAFVCCAPKQSTVETEGLEEVIVFGEEEISYVSEEPVLPQPVEEEVIAPPIAEEPTVPPPAEEIVIAPPPPAEEEPILPLAPLIEEEPPVVSAQPYVPPVVMPTAPPPNPPPATILGFRIQIFASSTEKNASRVADDARASFTQNVYVQYGTPYYKVRIGDFLTKEEAQIVKHQALQLGYRGTFVVETMISP